MKKVSGLLLLVAAIAPAQLARPDYAIVNAKVVVAPGKILPNATVVIRDGIIRSVGDPPAPLDVRVYDAKGLTVYPGLIDAASHYGFAPTARAAATASASAAPLPPTPAGTGRPTTPPDDISSPSRYLDPEPMGLNADVVASARMLVPATPDRRRSDGFTTTLAIPREGYWRGVSSLVQLGDGPVASAVVVPSVAMHVSLTPAQGPAAGGRRYPTSLMGVFAVLRQSLLRAQQVREAMRTYDAAGRKGLSRPTLDSKSQALIPVLEGAVPVVFTAHRAEEIRRALRFADEFKLRPIILGGSEAWRVADLLKARNVPVLVDLALAPAGERAGLPGAPLSAEQAAAEANPAKLETAGVRFALVTAGAERIERVRERIATAVRRGLPPDAALRALTVTPAEIVGAGEQLGTIEPGKIANLVLADGDLLNPRSRVHAVMIDGRIYNTPVSPRPAAQRFTSESAQTQPAAAPAGEANAIPATSASAAAPSQNTQQPNSADDPTPVTPRAAAPADSSASVNPERRPPLPEPAPANLVIRNATLLTISNGVVPNGSVWIQNGKIKEVGRGPIGPADAVVVDGSGRFVMPGIVDSHSHSAMDGGVNETGSSVTAMTQVRDVLDPEDINIYRAAAAGVTTLNVLHGSANVIGGQNAVIKTKWGHPLEAMLFPGAPPGIKLALGENPKRVGQTLAARFPATRMGVENVVRESFRAAREYALQRETYNKRVAAGEPAIPPVRNLSLDALADVLAGKMLVHAHCYRADEISMLLDFADEFGFKIRSLQHVLEGYKVTEKIKRHGAGASTFADFWGYKMEAFDGTPYNAALMVRAGIRTAINSDSSERHRRLYQEAAKAMKYGGLTEDEALKLITSEPAWMLGVDKRVGAIQPGMDADLAIFNAHPFSAYARVEMTLIDGQIIFDRARDLKQRIPWREEFEPDGPASPSTSDEHADDVAHEENLR